MVHKELIYIASSLERTKRKYIEVGREIIVTPERIR